MVLTGLLKIMDCAGTGAHLNESQTIDATNSDSMRKDNVLAFVPRFAVPMQMAA
jgi:hypothetical protein